MTRRIAPLGCVPDMDVVGYAAVRKTTQPHAVDSPVSLDTAHRLVLKDRRRVPLGWARVPTLGLPPWLPTPIAEWRMVK
jgi:hypothetical protein